MKHCVAIGGALDVGAGICGCGMAGIPGIPGGGTPGGRAGAPGGACCCRAGSPPIWFICRDLAAYSGIWNPVPGTSVLNKNYYSSQNQMSHDTRKPVLGVYDHV